LAEIEKNAPEVPQEGEKQVVPQMDGLMGSTSAAGDEKTSESVETDADLEDSIKRLSQMSVEDPNARQEKNVSQEQSERETARAIPAD